VRPEPIALEGISIPAVAVDADFPIVAVAGVVRPRLIIARSVLASCSHEELRAVLATSRATSTGATTCAASLLPPRLT
jgi:hypothetical protein